MQADYHTFVTSALVIGSSLWLSHRIRALHEALKALASNTALVHPILKALACSQIRASSEPKQVMSDEYICVRQRDHGVDALKSMLAKDWIYDRHLVDLREDENVADALRVLHEHRSSCALVSSTDGALVGVLDLLDVVRYMLRGCGTHGIQVRRLIRLCTVCSDDLTLSDICIHLRAASRHVAIRRENGSHTIVSQRSIAQALFEATTNDTSTLTEKLDVPLVRVPMPSFQNVITTTVASSARDAFHKMAAYNITSIPVCDDKGGVSGVISATDILYARTDTSLLNDNVLKYVEMSRNDAGNARPATSVVSCTMSHTMLDCLSIMLTNSVHHVYVLSDTNAPIAVVSFVDVIRQL